MVKEVIIVGAGGTGREMAEAIEDINSLGRKWNLVGFSMMTLKSMEENAMAILSWVR